MSYVFNIYLHINFQPKLSVKRKSASPLSSRSSQIYPLILIDKQSCFNVQYITHCASVVALYVAETDSWLRLLLSTLKEVPVVWCAIEVKTFTTKRVNKIVGYWFILIIIFSKISFLLVLYLISSFEQLVNELKLKSYPTADNDA